MSGRLSISPDQHLSLLFHSVAFFRQTTRSLFVQPCALFPRTTTHAICLVLKVFVFESFSSKNLLPLCHALCCSHTTNCVPICLANCRLLRLLVIRHGAVFARTTPPFYVRPGVVSPQKLCTVLVRPGAACYPTTPPSFVRSRVV
ncbi:hypothetical protein T10_12323 [Trichinella papuae]|uniref:Uncharacterized protein n=1 Tax=Trichinella papuae TaxID=268474 RepID=A0A0V1M4S3_9BILA|nr:hypothetical protein T10_12323 [Trichinella papuae]